MLPQETSVRQLKKLRAETKGTDIGDLTKDDRLNHNVPNLQYIGNPIDTGIESWQEFCQKDNELQTIAFKSKLVNKPIVKENKKENMNDIKKFEHFSEEDLIINARRDEDEEQEFFERPLDDEDEDNTRPPFRTGFEMNDDEIDFFSDFEKRPDKIEEIDELETDDEIFNDEDEINDEKCAHTNQERVDYLTNICKDCNRLISTSESVKTFEAFSVPAAKKEAKQPEYTILGEEKEPKSDPNFGYAAVRAQEIKKISDFNLIDPPTPKERTIGGNAGVFIDNATVKGYLNRIEGKDAYVEPLDEPMVIKKFSLKDVVKTKKSE